MYNQFVFELERDLYDGWKLEQRQSLKARVTSFKSCIVRWETDAENERLG